jgi:hypothetical protein
MSFAGITTKCRMINEVTCEKSCDETFSFTLTNFKR